MKAPPAVFFLLGVLVGCGIGATVTRWLNPPVVLTRPVPLRKRR